MDKQQIYTIPASPGQRRDLRTLIDRSVAGESLAPPLSMEELMEVSDRLIRGNNLDPALQRWIMVEINNALWKDTVASIPAEKRMLLLPGCLSHSVRCTAETDELGLLCRQCRNCSIAPLEAKAEQLGIMSMVAEGFTSVIGLIESQVIDTVIGVGCLESLEKVFPLLINQAVLGIAIPLNKAGCRDTSVDTEYVEQMLALQSGKRANLLDHELVKNQVKE
ncbi:MAG: DUF116 domain-containing protein [Bacteroides sp.]|nr:DUF116 domain-containing protein [Bacteroides sp.]